MQSIQGKGQGSRQGLLQLAAVSYNNRLGRLASSTAIALDLLDNIHALAHMAEDNVLACM